MAKKRYRWFAVKKGGMFMIESTPPFLFVSQLEAVENYQRLTRQASLRVMIRLISEWIRPYGFGHCTAAEVNPQLDFELVLLPAGINFYPFHVLDQAKKRFRLQYLEGNHRILGQNVHDPQDFIFVSVDSGD